MKADHAPVASQSEAPNDDFMRRVLGSKPSTRELSRYAELVEAARGRLSASSKGDIMVDNGDPLEGTSLVSVLQYLIRGARGRSKPAGI